MPGAFVEEPCVFTLDYLKYRESVMQLREAHVFRLSLAHLERLGRGASERFQYRWILSGRTIRYTLGGVAAREDERFYELSGWYPDKTPYGDDLNFDTHALGVFLGVSGSF